MRNDLAVDPTLLPSLSRFKQSILDLICLYLYFSFSSHKLGNLLHTFSTIAILILNN